MICDNRAVTALIEALSKKNENLWAMEHAAQALSMIGDDKAIRALFLPRSRG